MKTHSRKFSKSKRSTSVLPLAALSLGVAFSGSLTGCSGEANGGSFSSSLSSVEVDQNAGFTVTPTFANAVTSNTHVFGAFTSPCSISVGQARTDQKCMTNARETDVFANAMTIALNVPAGMCKYLEEIPYFYYNRRPGSGPSSYSITTTDGNLTSCTVGGVAGSIANGFCRGIGGGTTAGQNGAISSTGAVSCGYDYSQESPAGPNCCVGQYSVTVTTNTTGTTPSTKTVSGSGTYAGVPGSCIAGPGASKLWPVHVANGQYKGFPGSVLVKVPDNGYAATLENRIPQVYVQGAAETISISNFYFNWSSYLSSGNSVVGVLPPPINPGALVDGIDTSTGLPLFSTSPSWIFQCQDEAHEIIHSIALYVNEWDTNEEYQKYLISSGTQGNPSNALTDMENVNCFSGSIGYGRCNDFFSLRDFSGTYGIGSFPANAINDAEKATAN